MNDLPRIRTIPKAVEEIRAKDPATCINVHAHRHWVKQGRIPFVKTGKNFFINMADLEKFLLGG